MSFGLVMEFLKYKLILCIIILMSVGNRLNNLGSKLKRGVESLSNRFPFTTGTGRLLDLVGIYLDFSLIADPILQKSYMMVNSWLSNPDAFRYGFLTYPLKTPEWLMKIHHLAEPGQRLFLTIAKSSPPGVALLGAMGLMLLITFPMGRRIAFTKQTNEVS